MDYPELTLDQRRHLIDVQQRFEAWRTADRMFRESNKGAMAWKRVGAKEYLYRIVDRRIQKSLGPRSPETERLKQDYMASRTANRARLTQMKRALEKAAPVSRALGLARVPRTAARLLRSLDHEGLLGDGLFVVGTHALYAYEARSGIVFDPELLATLDLDLLADVRSRLVLAIDDKKRSGILAALQKADSTFEVQGDQFRAVNSQGYFVDVIRPMSKDEITADEYDLGGLIPAAIDGLKWLVNSPRFEATAIGEDGMPVWMSCIDPRAFALHKLWVSRQPGREAIKRRRDESQARAVAHIAQLLGLKFDPKELSALPSQLFADWKALLKPASEAAKIDALPRGPSRANNNRTKRKT
jgi:hypothetical protein